MSKWFFCHPFNVVQPLPIPSLIYLQYFYRGAIRKKYSKQKSIYCYMHAKQLIVKTQAGGTRRSELSFFRLELKDSRRPCVFFIFILFNRLSR
jgi:hypothetical protein